MSTLRNVCVYGGSRAGSDDRFVMAAETLGRALAAAGLGLVFGGGHEGIMGAVARGALEGGGQVVGIIPRFLIHKENALFDLHEMVVVEDMHERKRIMYERADAFVALPGGVGTLEELTEQMTWAQLQRHKKPVLIADIAGFWRPLVGLLAHMRQTGFLRESFDVHYLVAERAEDIVPMLQSADRHSGLLRPDIAAGAPS